MSISQDDPFGNGLSSSYYSMPQDGETNMGDAFQRLESLISQQPAVTPVLQPLAFDPDALFKQMQDSFQQQLDAFKAETAKVTQAQTTAQTNTNNYNNSNQTSLNGTAQGSFNPSTTEKLATSPKYKSGAQIKSNAISRYLAKDMWANKIQ